MICILRKPGAPDSWRGRFSTGRCCRQLEVLPHVRRGVAATELAVLLPFLALLFVVVLDFCRIYYYAQTLENAARCGALYASGTVQPPSGTSSQTAATQAALAEAVSLNPALDASDVAITTSGSNVTVTVNYQFQTVTSYPALPAVVPMSFSATFPMTPVTS